MLGSPDGDPLAGLFSDRKDEKSRKKSAPKVSSRELNPYFKDGGSGLPSGAELLTRGKFVKPSSVEEEDKADLSNDSNAIDVKRPRREDKISDEIKRLLCEERQDEAYSYDKEVAKKTDTLPPRSRHRKIDDTLREAAKMGEIQSKCQFCFDSETMNSSLIISIGTLTYLTLPPSDTVDPLHCCIIPIEHCSSSLQCNEDTWEEIRNYKKCLLQLAAALGRTAIFMEIASRVTDPRVHNRIDVVFLKPSIADPKGYFKKALTECDEEWSTNKRLIDTAEKGGLRKSIPKGFPYCYVDFRLDQGYAHVIEDTFRIRSDFLLDLAANLLCLERHQWKGKGASRETVEKFKKLFEPYDWALLLNETVDS